MNSRRLPRFIVVVAAVIVSIRGFCADDAQKTDPRYPFRTEFANPQLPWYQPKPLEFPPYGSERRIAGELVTLDFYHRKGQFRTAGGELHDFAMPPYGTACYLNTEVDLRDLPLATRYIFFLHQDPQGQFTRLATVKDQYSLDAADGISYKLDEVKLADGKLLTTRQKNQADLGRQELLVSDQTHVWKGGKQVHLSELATGDALLFNTAIESAGHPGRCIEIWAGTDAQKQATEEQRKKYAEFLKFRGIPCWIEKTEGNKLVVTLFSADPQVFKTKWAPDFQANRDITVAVANDELRTWNPPVDQEYTKVDEVQSAPQECFGCSGVRLLVTVRHMLEGFRKGHIVRLFGPGWKSRDMPFGEGIYTEMQTAEINVLTPKEFPEQFPFRTDYGNEHLPWYQLKPGEVPPHYSAHVVFGELLKIDPEKQTGQFRVERTGETVDFSMVPQGAMVALNTNKIDDGGPVRWNDSNAQAMYLNAVAGLDQIPVGIRYRFDLYQDEHGAFTKANLITDEFSYLALNKIVYRVDALLLTEGKLHVARQIPQRKNYNGDMVQPPDIGCAELRVNAETRVWKGEQQVKLTDLAVGDLLLVNITAEQSGKPSCCTEIWIGTDTHAKVTEQQRKKRAVPASKKP